MRTDLYHSNPDEMTRFALEYCRGSGRFCGAVPGQGLIQQATTPATMATSARLKTYQLNRQLAVGNVKKHEIGDPAIGQPVDGIADRPADDEAERQRGQPVCGPRQPDPEQQHRHRLEAEQHPLAERALAVWNRP